MMQSAAPKTERKLPLPDRPHWLSQQALLIVQIWVLLTSAPRHRHIIWVALIFPNTRIQLQGGGAFLLRPEELTPIQKPLSEPPQFLVEDNPQQASLSSSASQMCWLCTDAPTKALEISALEDETKIKIYTFSTMEGVSKGWMSRITVPQSYCSPK